MIMYNLYTKWKNLSSYTFPEIVKNVLQLFLCQTDHHNLIDLPGKHDAMLQLLRENLYSSINRNNM